MRDTHLELAGDYLLMAAMLIEIKTRMLLPRPPKEAEQEGEDPRAELVRRLLEYEQMNSAAQAIDTMPRVNRDFSVVDVMVETSLVKRVPTVLMADLTEAWRVILNRAKATQKHRVGREELSVRAQMSRIMRQLAGKSFVPFEELFTPEEGVAMVVVTFLAVLEMAREALLDIAQTSPFEPIYVKLRDAEMPALVS